MSRSMDFWHATKWPMGDGDEGGGTNANAQSRIPSDENAESDFRRRSNPVNESEEMTKETRRLTKVNTRIWNAGFCRRCDEKGISAGVEFGKRQGAEWANLQYRS